MHDPYARERRYCVRDCFVMETSREFREFADQCESLAQQAENEHHRKILKKMAEAWRKVADEKASRP